MKSTLKRDLLKQLIPVAVVATVAAVLLVAPAFAGKPSPTTKAWIAVNSTAGGASTNLVQGNNLVFNGCGYAANSSVTIVVNSPYAISFTGAPTGSDGCFSSSSWGYTALMSGSYTVQAWQSSDRHAPTGSLTFTVN